MFFGFPERIDSFLTFFKSNCTPLDLLHADENFSQTAKSLHQQINPTIPHRKIKQTAIPHLHQDHTAKHHTFNIYISPINLQLLPKMDLIREKLKTLLALIILKEQEFDIESRMYPKASRELLDASNSLKKQINEIIQYIASAMNKSKDSFQGRMIPNLRPFCSSEELSKMSQMKFKLEDFHLSLLKVTSQGKAVLSQIKAETVKLIATCDHNSPKKEFLHPHEENNKLLKTDYLQYLTPSTKRNYALGRDRQTEEEKAARIKGQLYKEMNNHLSARRNSSKDQLTTSKEESTEANSPSNKPLVEKEKRELQRYQILSNEHNKKKKFNYLEECEKDIKDPKRIPYPLDTYSTPQKGKERRNFESTQANSAQLYQEQSDPLGDELERIPPIKYSLQNQKQSENQYEYEQFFPEDSIQMSKLTLENHQDSLQIMKLEQTFNKTAFFGISLISNKEKHEYSFSNDIK